MELWKYEERIIPTFQFPFDKRVMLYRGARSTGKSYNMARNVVLKAIQDHISVLCVRNTKESIEDSIFEEIKEALDELDVGYKATVNPLRIVLENGIKFLFRGLNDTSRLKSIKANPRLGLVWFEESTEIQYEEDVRKIMLSIRKGERHYLFTYNPENPKHWIRKWEEERGVNITTCFDNPYNDEIFYEELEIIKKTDPKEYRKVALGEWVETGQDLYNVTDINVLKEEDVKHSYSVISIGVDLGENDATTFVASALHENGKKVHVVDQYYHSNKGLHTDKKIGIDVYANEFETFYNMVRNKYPSKYLVVYVESAIGSLTFLNLLKSKGINAQKVNKKLLTIENRVSLGKFMISTGNLKIKPELNLFNAFKSATRDELATNNDYYRKDSAGDTHSLDAWEYSIIEFSRNFAIPEIIFKGSKTPRAIRTENNSIMID